MYNYTVYSFWTDNNPITPRRLQIINSNILYFKKHNIEYKLITPQNLNEYLIYDKLHEGYKYLSSTHKSDYLRCYFMHFIGGGYTDIKLVQGDWFNSFKLLEFKQDKYCNGYREPHRSGVARCHGNDNLYNFLCNNVKYLNGLCSFIFKPNTPLTNEWYNLLKKQMDLKLKLLEQFPGRHPREGHGDGNDPSYNYPIIWSELLGNILHPLYYKYKEKLLQTLEMPLCHNYR
jgi:hypothetical protein